MLGVATAETTDPVQAENHSDYAFALTGLLGLADPIRASDPEAVADCRSAGIRVVMITGDYPATARAIAAEAGIAEGEVMTGRELARLSDTELALRLKHISVFARIMPEQKLRIDEAYKAGGEVVAMTGDGVNDAPSLKAAPIGVAMGKRGTDVAREASSIALLEMVIAAILVLILVNRSFGVSLKEAFAGRNLALRYVLAAVGAVSAVVLLTPQIRAFLRFGALHAVDLAIVAGIGAILFLVLELLKPFANRGQNAIHRHAHA